MTQQAQGDPLRDALARFAADMTPAEKFAALATSAEITMPLPGAGHTLRRWQMLSDVAAHDLSLVKLFEGHTDALAILQELGDPRPAAPGSTLGVWAAESPGGRVTVSIEGEGLARLYGVKHWCSGARSVSHALLTAWSADGRGPFLVKVALRHPCVTLSDAAWQAVGMVDSGSMDVRFDDVPGEIVGKEGDYVARPGFMQGGAGIAACWFGGAAMLGSALHRAVAGAPDGAKPPFRAAGLGKVDVALCQTAALLRETALWIDRFPRADASIRAIRVRQSADACARVVLDEVGRAFGATPFCRDQRFARMAADLPVFTRQSLAERDFQSLGERVSAMSVPHWMIEP